MKKILTKAVLFSVVVLLTSCLTTTEKKIMDPPWKPSAESMAGAASNKPPVGQIAPVYFSKASTPVIDGNFDDWDGLTGINTRVMVYGGLFDAANTDGQFVVRTDGANLYLYANITDNNPNANLLPVAQAWRGDSIEFFFGTDTMYHTFYKNTDKRIRIIPRSKTNKFAFGFSVNDVEVQSDDIKVATVFSATGYRIEAAFPLSLLNQKSLRLGQKVRTEFQINDADDGKERSRLVHWMSQKDVSYMDASTWGDGKVVPLPKTAQAGAK
jgi:hypothetical protein